MAYQLDHALHEAVHSFIGDLTKILLWESTVDFSPNELQLRECLMGKNAYILEPEATLSEVARGRRHELQSEPMIIEVSEIAMLMALSEYNKDQLPPNRLQISSIPNFILPGNPGFITQAATIYGEKHSMLREHFASYNHHMEEEGSKFN
jgi:hypothetical protein